MFRNARIYRLGAPFGHGAAELEAALETHRFCPCGPVEVATLGWSAPLGEDTAALVHGVVVEGMPHALNDHPHRLFVTMCLGDLRDQLS